MLLYYIILIQWGGDVFMGTVWKYLQKGPNPYWWAAKLTTYEINLFKQQHGYYPWETPRA